MFLFFYGGFSEIELLEYSRTSVCKVRAMTVLEMY